MDRIQIEFSPNPQQKLDDLTFRAMREWIRTGTVPGEYLEKSLGDISRTVDSNTLREKIVVRSDIDLGGATPPETKRAES